MLVSYANYLFKKKKAITGFIKNNVLIFIIKKITNKGQKRSCKQALMIEPARVNIFLSI